MVVTIQAGGQRNEIDVFVMNDKHRLQIIHLRFCKVESVIGDVEHDTFVEPGSFAADQALGESVVIGVGGLGRC